MSMGNFKQDSHGLQTMLQNRWDKHRENKAAGTETEFGNTAGCFPWMMSMSSNSSGHKNNQSSVECSKCSIKIHRGSAGAHNFDK
ncbi:hypothetical protein BGZ67_008712 [Mortierella alpina]|nr:hypothetical protein BGZ67_008712 [Mortierella alpina]